MSQHRHDRMVRQERHALEEESLAEMAEEAREVAPEARLGVPGRRPQRLSGERSRETGEVKRR